MPRIPAALASLALLTLCIGFNAVRYPTVWKLAEASSSTGLTRAPAPVAAISANAATPSNSSDKPTPGNAKLDGAYCTPDGKCFDAEGKPIAKPENRPGSVPGPGNVNVAAGSQQDDKTAAPPQKAPPVAVAEKPPAHPEKPQTGPAQAPTPANTAATPINTAAKAVTAAASPSPGSTPQETPHPTPPAPSTAQTAPPVGGTPALPVSASTPLQPTKALSSGTNNEVPKAGVTPPIKADAPQERNHWVAVKPSGAIQAAVASKLPAATTVHKLVVHLPAVDENSANPGVEASATAGLGGNIPIYPTTGNR
jgi:hypothetical protein